MEGDHRVWPPRPGARHRRSPPYNLPATRGDDAAGPAPDGDGEDAGGERAFDWSDLGGFTAGGSRGGTVTGSPRRGRRTAPEGPAQITAGRHGGADEDAAGHGGGGEAAARHQDAGGREEADSGWNREAGTGLGGRTAPGRGGSQVGRPTEAPPDDGLPFGDDDDIRWPSSWRDSEPEGLEGFDDDPDDHHDGPGDGPGDDPGDEGRPWSPRFGRTRRGIDRDDPPRTPWESLPPSARLYGSPADPGLPARARGRGGRRAAGALLALLMVVAVAAGLVTGVRRIAEAPPETGRLDDRQAQVAIPLPPGWRAAAVPPVTGFTSAARSGDGAVVMARPYRPEAGEARRAAVEAAELYSRLLLKGDRVSVVEDRSFDGGHTRALRAEYQDVVNRPAYLRVILLTRERGSVLVVGLLQPDEPARRPALDTLMASVR